MTPSSPAGRGLLARLPRPDRPRGRRQRSAAMRVPLRVFILIDRLGNGGAETILCDLAEVAPDAGLQLDVGTITEPGDSAVARRLRSAGIEPLHLPVQRLLDPRAIRVLRRAMAAQAPDIVHTHLAYADTMGGLAARSLGLPAVSTVHLMRWEQARRDRVKDALAARIRRHCMRRVIAVSDAGRRAYLERGWDRPDRVVTVRNGIARRPMPGAGRDVRARLGIGPDERVVTMLTVLRPGKGHEEALASLPGIRSANGAVRLVIAGDGPSRPALEAAAASLGDQVIFTGHVDDVMALLDASDLLLHPTHADALPTALIEAAAAGVPVVATRIGGVPEIVDDGRTGVLIAPPPTPEAIVGGVGLVLRDGELARRLSAAARERFTNGFAADRWSARLRALYEEAIDARS